MAFRFAYGRPPAVAAEGMVATSQPLATRAGLRMLEQGGNAADAALAAAAVLCVTEPMSTGIGGDAFAIVSAGDAVEGLDAAGPAPRRADPVAPVEERGPRSVTVPGAVAGWVALAARHGRLGLDACLADAIDIAECGFAVAARAASAWAALERDDLAGFEARWVEPLRIGYRGYEVLELPPPTQGVAALEGLGLLEGMKSDLPSQIDCVRLALEDACARVRDGADVSDLLAHDFLEQRRPQPGAAVSGPAGGTVYLCAVDRDRMAVSFIQSLFGSFGSGLVAPGTGVVLQNRGGCFAVQGKVVPGKRPYHTIIPGLLRRNGDLVGPFGVMGGFIQAQAHVQLVSALVDDGLDPQAALDRPRFWIDGELVRLEEGLWRRAQELERIGYQVTRDGDTFGFGGGQAIIVDGEALLGGSDPRKDGYAAGL